MTGTMHLESGSRQKLEVLLNISRALGEEIHLDNLLTIMVGEVTRAMQAERSSLFVHDAGKGELFTKVAEGMQSKEIRLPVGVGIVGMAAATRSTINIPDAYQDLRFNPAFDKASGFVTRSILSMPIFSQHNRSDGDEPRLLGVVQVLNKRDGSAFTRSDEQFLEAICVQLSLAFERVELVDSYVRAQKTQQYMKLAREIQMGLLSTDFALPQWPQLDLYGVLDTALEVGGDLYDFFPIDADRLFFLIGDVSDKGVPASLFMAITRTAFRMSALAHPNDVATTLAEVNNVLSERNGSGMFVTLFCGIFDVRTGRVQYADAGHEPPYIVRAGRGVEALDKVGGLALGIISGLDYSAGYIQLAAGDTLVLYTDGVTEALNADRAMFDEAGIVNALSRYVHSDSSTKSIVDRLLHDVREFVAGAPQSDDITILALRTVPA